MKLARVSLLLALLFAQLNAPASAGPNADFTLPLHATSFPSCPDPLPIDCQDIRPATTIPPGSSGTVLVLIANHVSVTLVQAAVVWDHSWTYCCAYFDCQPFQGAAVSLDNFTLSFATVFPCLTGQSLSVLGRIIFQTGDAGCLRFAQPIYSGGIYAQDCALQDDMIPDVNSPRLGRVCVTQAGHDACDPLTPVAPATWGAIKSSYR